MQELKLLIEPQNSYREGLADIRVLKITAQGDEFRTALMEMKQVKLLK